ncbi:MAG: oligosaccharide flippase family protein [Phycisphaerae bacterium]|nr:oligosaccharide flippase family protein [Phycisphaerae bacterium]
MQQATNNHKVPPPPVETEPQAPAPRHYSTIVRNVVTNWMWFALVLASGLIVPRFIGQHQGKEMLGVWDLGWSLGFYVGLFSLGLTSAVTRYVAQHRTLNDWPGLNRVVNTGLAMMCVGSLAGVVCAVGLASLTPWLVQDAGPETVQIASRMILLLSIGSAIQLPGTIFGGIITGYERYDLHNLIRGACDAVLLIVMIALLVSGCSLVTLAWLVLLMEVPSFLARMWVARRLCPHLRLTPAYLHWSTARDMVVFSGKSILQWAASSALYQLNGILVSAFMGPAALAVYSRQRVLVFQAMRFIRQYAVVFAPSSSALNATGDEPALRNLMLNSSRYGMYFTLPIMLLLMIMGGPLVDLWMRPGYAAPAILTIMALGHLLSIPQFGVYTILMGMGRHGVPAMLDTGGAVLSVLLAVLLMGGVKVGMVGGALAMAIPVALVGGVLVPVYACRILHLRLGRYIRGAMLGPTLANIPFALCLLTARRVLPDNPLRALVLGLAAGAIVNLVIYWKWVFPRHVRVECLERLGIRREPAEQRPCPAQATVPAAFAPPK